MLSSHAHTVAWTESDQLLADNPTELEVSAYGCAVGALSAGLLVDAFGLPIAAATVDESTFCPAS
jgi:hypothetical protein